MLACIKANSRAHLRDQPSHATKEALSETLDGTAHAVFFCTLRNALHGLLDQPDHTVRDAAHGVLDAAKEATCQVAANATAVAPLRLFLLPLHALSLVLLVGQRASGQARDATRNSLDRACHPAHRGADEAADLLALLAHQGANIHTLIIRLIFAVGVSAAANEADYPARNTLKQAFGIAKY